MLDTDLLTSLEAMFQTPRMRQDQELLDAMNGRMMLPVGALAALLRGRGQGEVSEDDIVRVGKGTKKFVLEEERTGFYVGPVPQALQKGRCVLAIQPHSITRQEVQGLIPQFSILHSFLIPEALLVAFDDERIAKNAFLELQGKKLKGALVVAKVRLEQFLHIIYSNQATMSHPPNQGRKHMTATNAAPNTVQSQPPQPVPMPLMPPLFPIPFFQPFGLLPMPTTFPPTPMPNAIPQSSGKGHTNHHKNNNNAHKGGHRPAREIVIPTPASGVIFRPAVPKEAPVPLVPPSPETLAPSPVSPLTTSQKFRLDPYSFVRGTVEVKERVVQAAVSESRESPTNPDTGSGGPSSSDQSPPVSARPQEGETRPGEPETEERVDMQRKPLSYAAMLLKPKKAETEQEEKPKSKAKDAPVADKRRKVQQPSKAK